MSTTELYRARAARALRPRPLGVNWVRAIPADGADREWYHVNGLWRMRARRTLGHKLGRDTVIVTVTTPDRKHYRRNRSFTLMIFADNGTVHPASPFGVYVAGSTDTRIPAIIHAAMTRAASYFLDDTLAEVPEARYY